MLSFFRLHIFTVKDLLKIPSVSCSTEFFFVDILKTNSSYFSHYFCSFKLTPAQTQHALPVFSLVGTSLQVQDSDDDDLCEKVDAEVTRSRGVSPKCKTVSSRYRCVRISHIHRSRSKTGSRSRSRYRYKRSGGR